MGHPLSASRFEFSAVHDVDAMAASMADGFLAEYVQLDSTRFAGRSMVVRFGGLVLQYGREDSAVLRRLKTPADRWGVIVPIAVAASARWDGRAVSPDSLIVCPPGSASFAFDPAGTEFAVISSASSSLMAQFARAAVPSGSIDPLAMVSAQAVGALRKLVVRILRRSPTSAALVNQAATAELVDIGVAACLRRPVVGQRKIAEPSPRSRMVRLAEDFLRRSSGAAVSVTQLSAVVGVSERTLRSAFCEVYTTSPKRYMKLWQLHQVRRALRSADNPHVTVTDVALSNGFSELGRFAGEYKALFGEAPSQTLGAVRRAN